jgi:hypothetical protein
MTALLVFAASFSIAVVTCVFLLVWVIRRWWRE